MCAAIYDHHPWPQKPDNKLPRQFKITKWPAEFQDYNRLTATQNPRPRMAWEDTYQPLAQGPPMLNDAPVLCQVTWAKMPDEAVNEAE